MSLTRKIIAPRTFSFLKTERRHIICSWCSTSQVLDPAHLPGKQLRDRQQKVKQAPFVKDLFLGIFNKDVLVYPEVLQKEKLAELDKMSDTLKRYFMENVNSHQIDRDGKIPENVMSDLKKLGMFGLLIPTDYGGLELTVTEYAKLAEIIGQDSSISRTIGAHELLAIQTILSAGNKEQKEKYLPRLARGEAIAAFCVTELLSGSDPASIKTKACYSADRKMLTINGNKSWITNGDYADIYIVASKIQMPERNTEPVGLIIVEKDSPGVKIGPPEETLGIRGCNISSVSFKDTLISNENLLGSSEDGLKLILNSFNMSMFGVAASLTGLLKKLYDMTVDYTIHRDIYENRLSEYELIQEKLAKMACKIYAIESMTYLTAGILDMVEKPDCILENAILKVFSSEQALWCVNESMQIFGGRSYMKSYPYERYLRDCIAWTLVEGSPDMLRMYIALGGCSYAGFYLEKDIRKMRNPFFNPLFVVRKMLTHKKAKANLFKSSIDIAGHLHPTLKSSADDLEKAVNKFQVAVELILARYGQEIVERQMELKRIADTVIELYAMTACLARSSRSYCIGLRNSDIEISLAHTYCLSAIERVEKYCDEIDNGPLQCNDCNYEEIGSTLITKKGYAVEDPLKHNW